MTPQQQKEQDIEDLKKLGRATGRILLGVAFCAATYGAAGAAIFSAWDGVTFVRTYEGRAEHYFKDGTHRTDVGRGISFTNPFALASTTKWEKSSQTLSFRSDAEERDSFRASLDVSYVGPETSATFGAVRHDGWAAGDKALKEAFQKNSWTSYAAVDPRTQPQNAAILCNALTTAVAAGLDPKLEKVSIGCKIEVDVPFKGYTAKL